MKHLAKAVVLVLFAIGALSGCGGSKPTPPKKKEIPAWVSNAVVQDTPTKMYGIGTGKDRESAVRVALNDLISKLGISIESNYEKNERISGYYVEKEVKAGIKANVSKIKINNFQVVKSYRISYNEFAVMVEVDKVEFAKGLQNDLEIAKKAIDQELATLDSLNKIERYNATKKLAQRVSDEMLPKILILKNLLKDFDAKFYMDYVMSVKKRFTQASQNLQFYVSGNAKAAPFVDKVKKYLTVNDLHVSNTKSNSVVVKVEAKDNLSHKRGGIVTVTVKIGVYDDGKYIGGNTVVEKERYKPSRDEIYRKAAAHFEGDIKTMGINKLLGINLDI